MENKEKSYILAYDLLNIIACIAVVVLHVNGGFWGFSYKEWWKFSLLIETGFYWAVPVFFMLTGATLMDYRDRYDTKTFLVKRIKKTVIPFLFWSGVSIPWATLISGYLDISSISTWKGVIDTIINQKAMTIYWFFPPLFAVYLSIPVLSAIPKNKRQRLFTGMILYSFTTFSLLPTLCTASGIPMNPAFQNPLNGGGYLLFVLLGYCVTRYPLEKKQRMLIYLGGVSSWGIRYIYTLRKSYVLGNIDSMLSGYLNFPSVFLALAIFVWFWYHDWSLLNHPKWRKVIRTLSSACFGVYLIHFYILRFIIDSTNISMQTYKWSVVGVPVVYLLSLGFVLIMKRIPIVRRIIP